VWTLRFLCITLLLTPFRRVTGVNLVSPFRRMMGLYAFFYGTLHFSTYLILDRFAGLVDYPGGMISFTTAKRIVASSIGDIAMRPFITVGFTAFVLMVPLAVTSTKGWIRRMGGKKWAALHRLVYVSAMAGVVHYWWLVKADISRGSRQTPRAGENLDRLLEPLRVRGRAFVVLAVRFSLCCGADPSDRHFH
jgi:sulfoxide reductase heme-binding subunit YedZ